MTDSEKTGRQIVVDTPGMTSIVTKEYLILPFTDISINKQFFMWWTLFLTVFTSSATLIAVYTNWWQIAIISLATALYLKAWYIGWPATLLFAGILYFRYHRKKKRQKQTLSNYRQRR